MIARLCLSMLSNEPADKQWLDSLSSSPENKKLVNTKTAAGYSAMYYAVKTGNKKNIKKLISLGAKLDDTYNGLTLRDVVLQEIIQCQDEKEKAEYQDIEKYLAAKRIPSNDALFNKFKEQMAKAPANDQQWLIGPIKNTGFKKLYTGYCFGLAHMGAQALLLANRDKEGNLIHLNNFSNRVKHLAKAKNIYHDIEIARHKRILLVELEKNPRKEEKFPTIEDHSTLSTLSDQDKINLEIEPLLNGVELFQKIYDHPDLTSKVVNFQSPLPALELVPNIALEEQGGAVILNHFSKDYSKKENLIQFLSQIEKNAEGLSYPVVLNLGANQHNITVGFDPVKKKWHYLDANFPDQMGSIYGIEKIADCITIGLKTKLKATDLKLKVSILSTAAHAKEMQNKIIEPLNHALGKTKESFLSKLISSIVSIPFDFLFGRETTLHDEIEEHLKKSIKKYEAKQVSKNKKTQTFQSSTKSFFRSIIKPSESIKPPPLDEKQKMTKVLPAKKLPELVVQQHSIAEEKTVFRPRR